LLYQIEDLILKDTYKGLRAQTIELEEEIELIDGEHIMDYLLRTNKHSEYSEIITSNILNALIGDICQFLQIALFASLQQRLTVTFSLLRKPFCYDLLVILRLYLTDEFLGKFNNEDGFDTTGLTEQDKKDLLNASENMLFSPSIKVSEVYDYIFNPVKHDSLVNISNKALHPSTTRNRNNRTEMQNLNFVFSSKESVMAQWDYLYRRLPLLLLYLTEILDFILLDHLKLADNIYVARLTERANHLKQ